MVMRYSQHSRTELAAYYGESDLQLPRYLGDMAGCIDLLRLCWQAIANQAEWEKSHAAQRDEFIPGRCAARQADQRLSGKDVASVGKYSEDVAPMACSIWQVMREGAIGTSGTTTNLHRLKTLLPRNGYASPP